MVLVLPASAQWRRVEPQQQPQPPPPVAQPPKHEPQPPQPEQGVTFRTGTADVRVDVQAGDKHRLITDLTRADFLVFDEGVQQPIQYFGRESEPLDLMLLLDESGSMRHFLEQIAAAARDALMVLHPGDRAALMLFGRRADLRQELTADFTIIERGLREAAKPQDLGSGTQINPSIIAAAGYLSKNAGNGRRAVLILTDDEALHYKSPDEDAIRALLVADTVLNGIIVGKGKRPEQPKPGVYVNPDFTPADVFKIAEQTGGESVKAQHAGISFRDMIERIRTRYSIQYRAPQSAAAGSFRHIRVELSSAARQRYPNAWVRARSGYIVK